MEISDLAEYLPDSLRRMISAAPDGISELRLRRGGPVSATLSGVNRILGVCGADEIEYTVMKLCGGTLHAHEATLAEGYISFGDGGRAGVCSASGRIDSARDVTSVNIRLPRAIFGISGPVIEYISKNGYDRGILIYSPPAAGKTTVLRDIAKTLSQPPHSKRICLIDSRRELYTRELDGGLIDVIGCRDKGRAMSEAVRTMSPEYLICDEIGTESEAEAVIEAQNTGVPLIASAHCGEFGALMRRPAIKLLAARQVFDAFIGLTRNAGRLGFEFHAKTELERLVSDDLVA